MSGARAAFLLLTVLLPTAPVAAQSATGAYFEFLMARRLEGQGDVAGALAALKRAAEADRGSAEVRAEIAAFQFRQNRREEAETAANDALALDAGNLEAHRVLGLIRATASDASAERRQGTAAVAAASQAVSHLERVAGTPAADANIQYTLGRMYLRTGQADRAVQALGRVVTQNPNSVQARLTLSQAYAAADDLSGAIETLADVVNDEPRVASTLALYQEQAGRLLAAAESYTIALRAAPMSRDLKFRRAAVLYNAREFERAAQFAAQAQAEHPEDARFPRVQAQALFDSGARARAVTVLEAAARTFPRDTQTTFALADMYNDVDRLPDAQRTLQQLIDSDPANAEALNYLGYMLANRGQQLDEAIRLVRRALDRDPDNPAYLDSLGWAHFRRGDLDEAEKYLRPAASGLPNNSVVQDHLGDVYARRGRWEEAIAAWERALKGDGQVARDVLERKIRDGRAKLAR